MGATGPAASSDGPRVPSLWRDGNFLRAWLAQALSQSAGQVAELAISVIAVVLLEAGEFEVGLVNAAQLAAFLVIGLPAGAIIDRLRKRRVMLWSNLVRAVALAVIPVLWAFGVLQVWQCANNPRARHQHERAQRSPEHRCGPRRGDIRQRLRAWPR